MHAMKQRERTWLSCLCWCHFHHQTWSTKAGYTQQ